MKKLLGKIFRKKLGTGKMLASGLGFILGLTLVLGSIQLYFGIREFLFPEKKHPDYIILNKEVDLGHTLFGSKASFADEEISKLRNQSFVEDLAVFIPNQFAVKAHAGGSMGLLTDLFFESLPTRFIDAPPASFRWNESMDVIPIIVSREFLNLYNFGFAVGKDKPQISESTLQILPVDITIYGAGGKKEFKARIVGFSDRIPSFLVPREFMEWANEHIAGKPGKPLASRVIIKVDPEHVGRAESYFEENGLSVTQDKIKYSKVMSVMNIGVTALVFTGSAFIFFALLVIILNFTLLIAETKEEISLLSQLGYKRRQILDHLFSYMLRFLLVVGIFSLAFFFSGNFLLDTFLEDFGIHIGAFPKITVLIAWAGVLLASLGISYFSLKRVIGKTS